jgi:hypothetical protein
VSLGKLNLFNNYEVKFGSINAKNPKVIYLNISAWGDPINIGEVDYRRCVRLINKMVKQSIYRYLTKVDKNCFMEDKTIVDIDIRDSGIQKGKRSYMNCEVTLFLENENILNDIIKEKTTNIIKLVIKEFDDNKYFKFYKRKKTI